MNNDQLNELYEAMYEVEQKRIDEEDMLVEAANVELEPVYYMNSETQEMAIQMVAETEESARFRQRKNEEDHRKQMIAQSDEATRLTMELDRSHRVPARFEFNPPPKLRPVDPELLTMSRFATGGTVFWRPSALSNIDFLLDRSDTDDLFPPLNTSKTFLNKRAHVVFQDDDPEVEDVVIPLNGNKTLSMIHKKTSLAFEISNGTVNGYFKHKLTRDPVSDDSDDSQDETEL